MKASKLFGALLLVSFAASAGADAPDKSFFQFDGQMSGVARPGETAFRNRQTISALIPSGTIADTSYKMADIVCCGGKGNKNSGSIAVPPGIYVEIGGDSTGEWGVSNIERSAIIDGDTHALKGYRLSADLSCEPSASGSGCNVHLSGWVKLRQQF